MTNQVVILTRDGETNNYIGNVAAGTYTLTADNYVDARTGNGKPYYSATSEEFTVATATTVPVTIDLRTPKNACVTYLLDASFSALYSDPTLTIDDNGHDVTLIAPAANSTDLTSAVYCHVASSPATEMPYSSSTTRTLSYTVSAAARATSHVTDIAAVTGTLTIASGRHTTITLSANPVTGELIPLVSGEHTGVFD